MHLSPRGFIALISAVIISTVLLTLTVSLGAHTYFARFNALNREFKRLSLGFAEGCVTTALTKIGADFAYTLESDPLYSLSLEGVPVSLGTLYGKDAQCVITDISAGVETNGKKTYTIETKADFNGAFSAVRVEAVAQNPAQAHSTSPSPRITLTSWVEIPY